MTDLPLSKYLDPQDDEALQEELVVVDRAFTTASEQHPARRWEYAMALRALSMWREGKDYRLPQTLTDVGGAGSPFVAMLHDPQLFGPFHPIGIIDPNLNETLAHALQEPPQLQQAVFCLSVLEHVEDLDQFLYHLGCLTAPGGLLFLTMDACDCPSHDADMEVPSVPDPHHFHWMRRRMFGHRDVRYVCEQLGQYQFQILGTANTQWPGPQVYDYSFFSLALIKRS